MSIEVNGLEPDRFKIDHNLIHWRWFRQVQLTTQQKKAIYFGSEFVSAVGHCLGYLGFLYLS